MKMKNITGFDWDDGNKTKCQKHGVSLFELESAFYKTLHIFPDLKHSQNEERYIALGVTNEGRHIFVIFTLREISEKTTFAQLVHVICTRKRLITMKKLPELKTDNDAEDFIDTVDLTEYDLSVLVPMKFEFQKKERSIILRLSDPLLEAIKQEATRSNMPYQRFIRQTLENAVHSSI
jgi:predicted DNA binding CopG/RHH family protein